MASHTTHDDVGKVAKAAGVKTLVLTHIVPCDDTSVTDEIWIEGAKPHFDGKSHSRQRPDGDIDKLFERMSDSTMASVQPARPA